MPVDIDRFVTPSDLKLIEKARRRGGKAAADKLIRRIADRVGTTTFAHNEKVAGELRDEVDRAWPPKWMTQPVRKPK
jgi:hypothetical protein